MKGKVYLIGAGPGDYELLTLKGLNCIRKADIVVYDRLANDSFLKETKAGCEFIYVGKESKNHTKTQDEINEIIAEEALEGKTVARLKGGDPYVFGRGGEEGEFLLEKGVDFEVVPGITSAIGGLCYAGIPITHRDYASSFHVITGHLKEEDKELNWEALAKLDGTLVFLMGMANLQNICNNLIEQGKCKDTPVAIINWATRPEQKVVTATLETIYEVVQREGIKPPSLIVVGGVVALRDKLNFFEKKPLFGKNIVVTRARTQSSKLVEELKSLGADVVEFPTIKIKEIIPNEQLDNSIRCLKEYSYVVFTSINGVNIFFKRLMNLGFDSRVFGGTKIVAIGSSTAKELTKYGLIADIVPDKFVAEELFKELENVITKEDKVLIPRASEAREILVEKLSKLCFVKEVKIYDTVAGEGKREKIIELLKDGKIDYITFTSSSTVKNLVKILGEKNLSLLDGVKLMSIGPITSKTIEEFGLKVYREAEEYTISGLVHSLLACQY
ncbi:uroporphyrinogen-III C-methyltransferase [Haloimpatiens massiliensis]|uniref:uroporphyrinogen-III C-methyltransferase n=1 Tax=Haloimpatiens massiliensis TaxID=1658110 RepID=UPI000C85ADCC|nr:uroporphyrinogen-III C-methyltransferase [Haloimpatiens massiliensis]